MLYEQIAKEAQDNITPQLSTFINFLAWYYRLPKQYPCKTIGGDEFISDDSKLKDSN